MRHGPGRQRSSGEGLAFSDPPTSNCAMRVLVKTVVTQGELHAPAAAGIALAAPRVADDRFFRELAAAKLQHLAVLRLAERNRHGLREVLLSERLSQSCLLRVEARGELGKSRG